MNPLQSAYMLMPSHDLRRIWKLTRTKITSALAILIVGVRSDIASGISVRMMSPSRLHWRNVWWPLSVHPLF